MTAPARHAPACDGHHALFGEARTPCNDGMRAEVQAASAALPTTVCARPDCGGPIDSYTGRCRTCGGVESKKAVRDGR